MNFSYLSVSPSNYYERIARALLRRSSHGIPRLNRNAAHPQLRARSHRKTENKRRAALKRIALYRTHSILSLPLVDERGWKISKKPGGREQSSIVSFSVMHDANATTDPIRPPKQPYFPFDPSAVPLLSRALSLSASADEKFRPPVTIYALWIFISIYFSRRVCGKKKSRTPTRIYIYIQNHESVGVVTLCFLRCGGAEFSVSPFPLHVRVSEAPRMTMRDVGGQVRPRICARRDRENSCSRGECRRCNSLDISSLSLSLSLSRARVAIYERFFSPLQLHEEPPR